MLFFTIGAWEAQWLAVSRVCCKAQGLVPKQDNERGVWAALLLSGPSLRASQDGVLLEGPCLKARYLETVDQESWQQ